MPETCALGSTLGAAPALITSQRYRRYSSTEQDMELTKFKAKK